MALFSVSYHKYLEAKMAFADWPALMPISMMSMTVGLDGGKASIWSVMVLFLA
jgi:hypothetical protein